MGHLKTEEYNKEHEEYREAYKKAKNFREDMGWMVPTLLNAKHHSMPGFFFGGEAQGGLWLVLGQF